MGGFRHGSARMCACVCVRYSNCENRREIMKMRLRNGDEQVRRNGRVLPYRNIVTYQSRQQLSIIRRRRVTFDSELQKMVRVLENESSLRYGYEQYCV